MPLARVREYRGEITLPSIEWFSGAFMSMIDARPVSLGLYLTGVSVYEGFEGDDPRELMIAEFKGRKCPKLDPALVSVTWTSTSSSSFEGDASGVHLYDGVVGIDPFRIRGHNHPSFNNLHSEARELNEKDLTFVIDPSWATLGQHAPLLADINLGRF
jgi:hypothetical protein